MLVSRDAEVALVSLRRRVARTVGARCGHGPLLEFVLASSLRSGCPATSPPLPPDLLLQPQRVLAQRIVDRQVAQQRRHAAWPRSRRPASAAAASRRGHLGDQHDAGQRRAHHAGEEGGHADHGERVLHRNAEAGKDEEAGGAEQQPATGRRAPAAARTGRRACRRRRTIAPITRRSRKSTGRKASRARRPSSARWVRASPPPTQDRVQTTRPRRRRHRPAPRAHSGGSARSRSRSAMRREQRAVVANGQQPATRPGRTTAAGFQRGHVVERDRRVKSVASPRIARAVGNRRRRGSERRDRDRAARSAAPAPRARTPRRRSAH